MNKPPTRSQELRGTTRLRSNELPPNTLVLLRGAPVSLDDLVEQAADSARRYTLDGTPFYALSLTAVLGGVTEDELLARPPLKAYPKYYRMTAGQLYAARYTVWETFSTVTHCDVRLPGAGHEDLRAFVAVAGRLRENRHYEQ